MFAAPNGEMWGSHDFELNRTIMQNMGMSRDRTVSEPRPWCKPESTKRSCKDKSPQAQKSIAPMMPRDSPGFFWSHGARQDVGFPRASELGQNSTGSGSEVTQFIGTCVYDNVV